MEAGYLIISEKAVHSARTIPVFSVPKPPQRVVELVFCESTLPLTFQPGEVVCWRDQRLPQGISKEHDSVSDPCSEMTLKRADIPALSLTGKESFVQLFMLFPYEEDSLMLCATFECILIPLKIQTTT